MTANPVSAAILHDRADANNAAVDALNAHQDTCTNSGWCARCTALARQYNAAYQSVLDAAAAVKRGAR